MIVNFKITNFNKNKALVDELLKHIEAVEKIKAQLSWEGKTDISVEFIDDSKNITAASGTDGIYMD